MKIEEMAEVLAFIALIDGRDVSEGMLLAWHSILEPTGVTKEVALEQIRKRAARSSAWITPADLVPPRDPDAWMIPRG